jgi:hypothetical protein
LIVFLKPLPLVVVQSIGSTGPFIMPRYGCQNSTQKDGGGTFRFERKRKFSVMQFVPNNRMVGDVKQGG